MIVSEVNQLSSINVQEVVTYLTMPSRQLKIVFLILRRHPAGANLETYLGSAIKGIP